ncbi:MAG: nuclear transport factor 2 family protein [Bacteroidota bacterium]
MKTLILVLVALVNLGAFAQSAEEKQLLALHERKFQWLAQKQYDSLTLLLDDRVLYIHSNGWTENKAEILADLQSGKLNYESVQVKEATARLYQDAGVVTGKGVFKVLMEGKSLEISLLYTEVYVRHKKQWRLVNRHACRL